MITILDLAFFIVCSKLSDGSGFENTKQGQIQVMHLTAAKDKELFTLIKNNTEDLYSLIYKSLCYRNLFMLMTPRVRFDCYDLSNILRMVILARVSSHSYNPSDIFLWLNTLGRLLTVI